MEQLLRFGVVSRRRAQPTPDVLDHRAHHPVLVDVGREQSALVQRVDRTALDIEVTGLAHRTDQLAWLRVPDELFLGPVRLPTELATMALLELRKDHGESRSPRAATDRVAERSERV